MTNFRVPDDLTLGQCDEKYVLKWPRNGLYRRKTRAKKPLFKQFPGTPNPEIDQAPWDQEFGSILAWEFHR